MYGPRRKWNTIMEVHAKSLDISSRYKTEQSSHPICAHEDTKDDQQANSQQTEMHISNNIFPWRKY